MRIHYVESGGTQLSARAVRTVRATAKAVAMWVYPWLERDDLASRASLEPVEFGWRGRYDSHGETRFFSVYDANLTFVAQSDSAPPRPYSSIKTKDLIPVRPLKQDSGTTEETLIPLSLVAGESDTALSPEPMMKVSATSDLTSYLFSNARVPAEKHLPNEMMFVLTAGQSLSRGTTLVDEFETVWPGLVDEDRAYMLDFERPGVGSRGWDYATVKESWFKGLAPLQSYITETPSPAMIAQLLDAYDSTGRVAPDMLSLNTGAVGASLLELMVSADDVYASAAIGVSQTSDLDLFAVARADGRYNYFLNEAGKATFLGTYRHEPGLWDTMEAQIDFAVRAAIEADYSIHDTVAMGFVHGQADARMAHEQYGYAWAAIRYFDMVEAALREATGNAELRLVIAMPQVAGDDDGNVPLDQLAVILSDERVNYAGTQTEFQGAYPSNPGTDNIHLSPEGYMHLGQTLGSFLGDALIGQNDDPILIEEVTAYSARAIDVHFSGVDSRLVANHRIFTAQTGVNSPDNLGFTLFDAQGQEIEIINAWIADDDTVRIRLGASVSGQLRLELGLHGQDLSDTVPDSAYESWNGTPLRDAEAHDTMILPEGYQGDTLDIYEFVPTQVYDFWL